MYRTSSLKVANRSPIAEQRREPPQRLVCETDEQVSEQERAPLRRVWVDEELRRRGEVGVERPHERDQHAEPLAAAFDGLPTGPRQARDELLAQPPAQLVGFSVIAHGSVPWRR
jgi:hypothetical protein